MPMALSYPARLCLAATHRTCYVVVATDPLPATSRFSASQHTLRPTQGTRIRRFSTTGLQFSKAISCR